MAVKPGEIFVTIHFDGGDQKTWAVDLGEFGPGHPGLPMRSVDDGEIVVESHLYVVNGNLLSCFDAAGGLVGVHILDNYPAGIATFTRMSYMPKMNVRVAPDPPQF
jgi:hypothetical protein